MRIIAIALVALALVACDDADEPTNDATMTADATSADAATDSTSSTTEDATSADGDAQEDAEDTAPACYDFDDDGYSFGPDCPSALPIDCDDNDAGRWPGNIEICDLKDNDCNGVIDDPGPGVTCP